MQRAPGGAGAAGDRGAGLEGELVRQRHEGARRALHVSRMGAMPGDAVDLGDALDAELHPAGRAVPADAAAAVVMLHHPHPTRACRSGTPAPTAATTPQGSCPAITGPPLRLEAERGGAAGGAVEFEIAAAHAGSLDLDARPRPDRGRDRENRGSRPAGRRPAPRPSCFPLRRSRPRANVRRARASDQPSRPTGRTDARGYSGALRTSANCSSRMRSLCRRRFFAAMTVPLISPP